MPSVWVNPTPNEWIMMAIIGLIASVAHLFIILSLKYADASKLAPLGYTEIITNPTTPVNKSVKSELSEVLNFRVITK